MDGGGQYVVISSVSQMLMLSVNNLAMRELEDMEGVGSLGYDHYSTAKI